MSKQETTHVIGVHHVGLSARDPAVLAAFYHDVLGLQVVGGSTADTSAFGASAFLSSHPTEESHDLALFANPAYQHTAFKVRLLAHLLRHVPARARPGRAGQDGLQPRCVYCLLLRGPGGTPDRGLLAHGSRPAPAVR